MVEIPCTTMLRSRHVPNALNAYLPVFGGAARKGTNRV
jgi:hypothetical protein